MFKPREKTHNISQIHLKSPCHKNINIEQFPTLTRVRDIMTNIIVACETDENQKITDVTIARDVHKQLGMPLLSTISQQLNQILDIGLRVCSMNVSDQLRSEINSTYEKKYSEKLKLNNELHISETKKLHTEIDNWKTKFSCMQSTVQEQCKSIVQDQTRQFQQTTSMLQSNVQQSIDDMKTKMIQFHSKTASTKRVGDKGENPSNNEGEQYRMVNIKYK